MIARVPDASLDHEEQRLRSASLRGPDGAFITRLSIPKMHCGGCLRKVEAAVTQLPFVSHARANLSNRSVTVTWHGEVDAAGKAPDHEPSDQRTPAHIDAQLPEQACADASPIGSAHAIVDALDAAGFSGEIIDAGRFSGQAQDSMGRHLLTCLGVAGFATANIMLLSVSVWSGATDATRDLFHLLSGLIAIPAVAFAGRPFFLSAWSVVRRGRMNMDVPITLAVLLAVGMSIFESLHGGQHAYFDAAVMLLFFLLIGRYLDHLMRARALSAVRELSALGAAGAVVRLPGGGTRFVPAADLEVGMIALVAAGERVPADGQVISGSSDVDRSIVTGESKGVAVATGAEIEAGTLNLTGPLDVQLTKPADQSFLAEITRMMEAAEQSKARYVRIADRFAQFYSPAVHLLAGLTFVAWAVLTGGDYQQALYIAIAVLIITCPCALGLAVPIAQVFGASRLMRHGIMLRDGAAFEKLARIDRVVFDKTGTLTVGRPTVMNTPPLDQTQAALARALAQASRHPAARAIDAHLAQRAETRTSLADELSFIAEPSATEVADMR
ncbi:MAG: heavy metal translocating P-type ATPase, partial [Pseudomonadota bacterium]